jgi:flavin reductase (DIM6/NTAB) family NADH-FMN oxidoreductase RutF
MSKQVWKPGNMLYPLPAVMVSCGNKKNEKNIITIAWTGTICTNPPMVYISVRPERYSYDMIKETGEFVINLTNKALVKATDYCGVRSGKDVDKFKEMKLTAGKAEKLEYAPIIEECPVSIECRVTEIKELGSHHMFLAEVLAVDVDEKYMNESGKFKLNDSDLIVYSHGEYFDLKEQLGTFGYSVRKNVAEKKKNITSEKLKKATPVTGNKKENLSKVNRSKDRKRK